MELLLIGGAIGFILGAGAVVIYFAFGTLVSANDKAGRTQRSANVLPQDSEIPASQEAKKMRSTGA